MGAAMLIARSRLRRNVTATLLLVVLAGVGGGVVMASIAGIRRADAAWERLLHENPPGDAAVLFFDPEGEPKSSATDDLDAEMVDLLEIEEVTAATRAAAAVGVVRGPGGEPYPIAANVYLDEPVPDLLGRPVLVAGRMPRSTAATEVAIDEQMADRLGVEVGDRASFAPFAFDELDAASDGRDIQPGRPATDLTVVGIVRQPGDLLPPRTDQYSLYSDEPYLLLTAAWWEANGPDIGSYGIFALVELAAGVGFEEFASALGGRFGDSALALPAEDEVGVPEEVRRAVDRQIGAEGRAVAAFALAAALLAVALLVLALARQLGAEGEDQRDLQALGLTRRALVAVGVLRSASVALGAGLVAVLVAYGLSAELPIGVGRRTLRDRGPHADLTVLALGFLAVVALVALVVALVSWRIGRPRTARSLRATLADRLARAGAPVPATVGVHFAVDRGPTQRSGRSTAGVVGLAVAVVTASAVLLHSFDALRSSPDRLGQVWHASAGNFASHDALLEGVGVLSARDDVDVVAGELGVTASVGGRIVSGISYVPFDGELPLELREGRAPAGPGEAVLGPTLARSLDVDVGDVVPLTLGFPDDTYELEVVGIGPVAAMGFELDPGRAVLVHDGLAERQEDESVSVLLVRFEPGTDLDGAIVQLKEEFPFTVLESPVPSRSVQTLAGLTALPVALGALVVLLALAASANGAIASVRRRRRDLAVLKVLGLERRRVRAVVRWQAITWAAVAAIAGLPTGVVLGSLAWREVLRSLGLDAPLRIPVPVLLVVTVAVPLTLLALTWWPARRAADTRPAVTLRSE